MRVITCCLGSTPALLLADSTWHDLTSETKRSATYLKFYTKALNPKHLLHETLHLNPSPKRLRSRNPLRLFVELFSTTRTPTASVPPDL